MSNIIKKYIESELKPSIRNHKILLESNGVFSPFPPNMDPNFIDILSKQGINQLYSHQAQSFESVHQKQNTLIVSKTASGKTLSFFAPILNDYLTSNESFSVLLLYPTKALSRDQESSLGKLLKDVIELKNNKGCYGQRLGTFDGDTPQEERETMQQNADFIITNPDMLHSGILPNNNRKWRTFLSRLKYIVIDEVHTYRGAYGSHAANVFRRLLRICKIHGSNPIFICSSATIGNPQEHTESLLRQSFKLIQEDGAPRPQRDLFFLNPALVQGHGDSYYRKGTGSIAIPLLRFASAHNVRTICFCRSRQQVERLYRAVIDGFPELKSKVKPYRGGLLPQERRQLEKSLWNGQINTIITTNALELGIDIGDLDLCVLSGHPGSAASFWQQAGRVGRKGNRAIIAYIAKNTPIDQYIIQYPEFVTESPIEKAWLNADNPYIFLQHLPCAAQEYPLSKDESEFDQILLNEGIKILQNQGTLKPYKDRFRYSGEHFPSRGVNLRGMTDYNIEIYCGTEVIGEIDPIGARGELYKDAIYLHLGRRYMSLELDLQKKLCQVVPIDVDYYTEAVWQSRVEITQQFSEQNIFESQMCYGITFVHRQPKLYKKIKERTLENIGYGPITLDAFEYETTGLSLLPGEDWQMAVGKQDKKSIGAALYGLSYILKRISPSFFMGDRNDIETDVALDYHKNNWQSSMFLFDSIEGGVGFSEIVYHNIKDILKMCLQTVDHCECSIGCPACIPPLPPGVEEDEMEEFLVQSDAAIQTTKSLLIYLLSGNIIAPQITFQKKQWTKSNNIPVESPEVLNARSRLSMASQILQRKKEREH